MHTEFKNKWNDIKEDFISKCLNTIGEICGEQMSGEIIIGSHAIRMKPNKKGYIVPYMYKINYSNLNNKTTDEVELYSNDGYNTMEDIAHITDVCIDVKNCLDSGRVLYDSMWNKEVKNKCN